MSSFGFLAMRLIGFVVPIRSRSGISTPVDFGFRISRPWRGIGLLVLLIVCAAQAPGCGRRPRHIAASWEGQTMGSVYRITITRADLDDAVLERVRTDGDAGLREVNRQMSHYQPDSEISQFNAAAAGVPFLVSPDFARVTRFALELWEKSGGLFDPTLGPLVDLWGFGSSGRHGEPPSDESVAAARRRCGAQHLRVTAHGALVKDVSDLQLNLSAVAKGFGVDVAAGVLRDYGIEHYLVEIGGEIVARGRNSGGMPWRVGIESPLVTGDFGTALDCVVGLKDRALATSGNYREFFTDAEGRRFSHILNPATGAPIPYAPLGVSVLADSCLVADGLATTLFVLGPEAGRRWIEHTYPDAAALFLEATPAGGVRRLPPAGFPSVEEVPLTQ